MSLSAALESFTQNPADLAAARGLEYDKAAGLALVAALTERKLRSHLEALGEVSGDKDVKKAARAAAYKLKSAGVEGSVQREATVDLSVKVETKQIAAATVPGFDGRLHLVLPALPGIAGGELDLRDDNKPRAEPLNELGVGRIRRFVADNGEGKAFHPPALVDMDLAVRLIELCAEAHVAGKTLLPPTFSHFQNWAARARSHGADGQKASARAAVGAGARPVPEAVIEEIATHPRLGYISAPASAFDAIDKEFRSLMHGTEPMERADFEAKAKALTDRAVTDWWASPGKRRAACIWLEASADCLLASGDETHAKLLLALADEIADWAGAPLTHPLIRKAFVGAIDLEHAWQHREAHVHGHAHHD
jgi:hypothetical protein